MLVRLPRGLGRTGAHLTRVSPAPNISHQPRGGKTAAKACVPTPTQGRTGSAQPQMETGVCARSGTERPERERGFASCAAQPACLLPCLPWRAVRWKAQRNRTRLLVVHCSSQGEACIPNVLLPGGHPLTDWRRLLDSYGFTLRSQYCWSWSWRWTAASDFGEWAFSGAALSEVEKSNKHFLWEVRFSLL